MPFAASKGKYNWSHNKIDYLLSGNSLRRFACGSSHSRGHGAHGLTLYIGTPASLSAIAPRLASLPQRSLSAVATPRRPGQQQLPDGSSPQRHSRQQLRHGVPASNKPHLAERSTPVWLAIWRIWAGFANSQLRRATFRSTYLYICVHPHCCTLGCCSDRRKSVSPSAPIAYATSVSPPDEAVAWPDAAFLQITFHAGCRYTHF